MRSATLPVSPRRTEAASHPQPTADAACPTNLATVLPVACSEGARRFCSAAYLAARWLAAAGSGRHADTAPVAAGAFGLPVSPKQGHVRSLGVQVGCRADPARDHPFVGECAT